MRRIGTTLAFVAGLTLVSSRASAAEPERVWDKHFALGAELEWPCCVEAITFEVAPTRWASLEVGAGVVAPNPALVATLHFQVPWKSAALGLEGGFVVTPFHPSTFTALGPIQEFGSSQPQRNELGDTAVFGRVGGSFALRSVLGLQARLHVGGMTLLDPTTACIGCLIPQPWFPYGGLTVGYAFNL